MNSSTTATQQTPDIDEAERQAETMKLEGRMSSIGQKLLVLSGKGGVGRARLPQTWRSPSAKGDHESDYWTLISTDQAFRNSWDSKAAPCRSWAMNLNR